ncbi:MAG: sulfide-dependent adenosine diphosphate thiazole synthase [Phycisphaerales bacterium]|jgi:thiamine thiazole synthase
MKEIEVSRAIIEKYFNNLLGRLENDVVIVGAGPAGLMAAYYLGKADVKTTVLEKKLSVGGGTWGGASGYNQVVFEDTEILDELGVTTEKQGKLYCANSIEFAAALTYNAKKASAEIFNLMQVEDIIIKKEAVEGVVINATPILMSSLHVDPYCIAAKYTVDATGHPAEVVNMLKDRKPDILPRIREGFMDVDSGERGVVEKAGEIYPGLFVAGMSVCAVYNLPRMGPIFGGMLKSGKRVAEMIIKKIQN